MTVNDMKKYLRLFESFEDSTNKQKLYEESGFTDELKEKIVNDEDYQKGDVHQAIMNIAHADWKTDTGVDSYSQMLKYANSHYGPLAELAILLGKYNYQVGNGGHFQYFDNGYASEQSSHGMGADHNDLERHHHMMRLMDEYGLRTLPLGSKVFGIMKDVELEQQSCDNCDGSGESSDDCDDCDGFGQVEENPGSGDEIMNDCTDCHGQGYVVDQCFNCGGSGESKYYEISDGGSLDKRYYAINDSWMKSVNSFFADKLKS